MKVIIACLLTFFCVSIGVGQVRSQIAIEEFIEQLFSKDTSDFYLLNTDIVGVEDDTRFFFANLRQSIFSKSKNFNVDADSLLLIERRVIIENSRTPGGFWFERFRFKKGLIFSEESDESPLMVEGSTINGQITIRHSGGINFFNNVLNVANKRTYNDGAEQITNQILIQTKADYLNIEGNHFFFLIQDSLKESEKKTFLPAALFYAETGYLKFSNNTFQNNYENKDSRLEIYVGNPDGKSIEVKENRGDNLHLELGYSLDRFYFFGNEFRGLKFSIFRIPDDNFINWRDISNAEVSLATISLNISNWDGVYNGSLDTAKYNPMLYRQYVKFYKAFYDAYKANGDIQSANQAYVKIRELENQELELKYSQNPSTELYFLIKINELLNFYTQYGTNPARSIIISIYIILAFGVFYFFFPSDWDVTSKSKLIRNFKDFIEKNEKGYLKPLLLLTLGFFISLINACALSLNAFTTLGFGNIPTHGIARYICVLQGFIGWFLLSLFTVALFNQVSF